MGTRKQRSAVRIEGTVAVAQKATLSTSVSIGQSFDVGLQVLSTTQSVAEVGGGLDVSGASQVYTLPASTGGTVWYIYCSTGATEVIQGASTSVEFFSLLGARDTSLTISTGDGVILIARSSSEFHVLAYSTNVTST